MGVFAFCLFFFCFGRTLLTEFYSPMGLDNWNNANKNYAQQVLMEKKKPVYKVLDGVPIVTFRGGKARGRLLGGNLSVFTAMIGSQYIPSPSTLKDTILFLEGTYFVDLRIFCTTAYYRKKRWTRLPTELIECFSNLDCPDTWTMFQV